MQEIRTECEMEGTTIMDPKRVGGKSKSLPPSCLGPDGKLRIESDQDRRKRLESLRRRLAEIEQMTDEDPPGPLKNSCAGSTKVVLIGPCSRGTEVADYEVRRELTRVGAHPSLRRLDQLVAAGRLSYAPVTTAEWRQAAV